MSLTLYYHPLASFCHKPLIALYELGIPFDKRLIDLGNAADRAELQAIWPFTTFPVLRDHTRRRDLPESSVIIEYLDHHHPSAHPLVPADWDDALDVRLWDRFFDNQVQLPMQAIVLDRIMGSKGDMARERARLKTAYAVAERRLASGTNWVVGEHFTLADCAAAPALFYAHTLEPFPAECPALGAYFERLVQRPSFRRVLEEAKPYLGMYPFADAVPARFR